MKELVIIRPIDYHETCCVTLYSLCSFGFLLNTLALLKMFLEKPGIYFEKVVLLIGLIEYPLISLHTFYPYDCVLDTLEGIQILVSLFICKRYLVIFSLMNNKLNYTIKYEKYKGIMENKKKSVSDNKVENKMNKTENDGNNTTLIIEKSEYLGNSLISDESKQAMNNDINNSMNNERESLNEIQLVTSTTKCINCYYILFLIIFFLIFVSAIVLDIVSNQFSPINNLSDEILQIYCLLISIVLFVSSILIKMLLNKMEKFNNSKKDNKDYRPSSATLISDERNIDIHDDPVLRTRHFQILLIGIVSLLKSIFESICKILEFHVYEKEVETLLKESELNIFELLTDYSIWASSFFNYIIFYFIIRKSFEESYRQKKSNTYKNNKALIITNTFLKKEKKDEENENSSSNRKDIKDFIAEEKEPNNININITNGNNNIDNIAKSNNTDILDLLYDDNNLKEPMNETENNRNGSDDLVDF